MKKKRLHLALIAISVVLFALPLITVHGAGGRIEGKITDPKGAIVVSATVTVTDPVTNQTLTAMTDKEGRYKIEGLPAGAYAVLVSAPGFSESRRDNVKLEDGGVAIVDIRL